MGWCHRALGLRLCLYTPAQHGGYGWVWRWAYMGWCHRALRLRKALLHGTVVMAGFAAGRRWAGAIVRRGEGGTSARCGGYGLLWRCPCMGWCHRALGFKMRLYAPAQHGGYGWAWRWADMGEVLLCARVEGGCPAHPSTAGTYFPAAGCYFACIQARICCWC
jgi:hypothetical protein